MLDGVKAGALGEHPAGKDALFLAGQLDLIDLDEGGGIGRFGRRARGADARRDLERAELHGLIDGNLQMRDAARDLVEGGEYGRFVLYLDLDGLRGGSRQPRGRSHSQHNKHKPRSDCPDRRYFHLLPRAAPC
jgi:hypothetical protein